MPQRIPKTFIPEPTVRMAPYFFYKRTKDYILRLCGTNNNSDSFLSSEKCFLSWLIFPKVQDLAVVWEIGRISAIPCVDFFI